MVAEEIERPAWLQKQVRDLAENWEIPLGAELEKYLDQLEKIEISFDDGRTTLNFIEAAMFIQGSACVYSRKVEYLYALAIATLDIVSSRKNQAQAPSVNDQGEDKDTTFDQHREHDELLDLDDIKESDNIELREEDDKSSNEGVKIIPRIPFALMPKSEMHRRGEDVLLNQKGEVIGSRNDFKLNTCILHSSGALLMDVNSISMLEKSISKKPSSTPAVNQVRSMEQDNIQTCDATFTACTNAVENTGPQAAMEIDQGNESYGDEGGLGYDHDADCNDNAPSSPLSRSHDISVVNLRSRRAREIENARKEARWEDPWEELDPYTELKYKERSFKKGRSFKIPQSLKDLLTKDKQQKRKKSPTGVGFSQPVCPIAEFCGRDYQSHSKGLGLAKAKDKILSEFEYLSRIENEKRKEARKKERRLLATRFTEEQIADIQSIIEPVQEGYDDDSDGGGGYEMHDDSNAAPMADDDIGFGDAAQEDPLQDVILTSYEDLVRQHINNYIEEAEHYAQQTELTKRVKEWQDKILPVLEEEENHRPYDIHQYSTEILDSFQELPRKTFKDVVKHKEKHEVCRYFLSTLLLANMCNVEIVQPEEQLSMDMINLKLLDKTPAHHAISNYKAPSLIS